MKKILKGGVKMSLTLSNVLEIVNNQVYKANGKLRDSEEENDNTKWWYWRGYIDALKTLDKDLKRHGRREMLRGR